MTAVQRRADLVGIGDVVSIDACYYEVVKTSKEYGSVLFEVVNYTAGSDPARDVEEKRFKNSKMLDVVTVTYFKKQITEAHDNVLYYMGDEVGVVTGNLLNKGHRSFSFLPDNRMVMVEFAEIGSRVFVRNVEVVPKQ